ncbi:Molybdenum_cofactor sulfurase [Hexamita inflata]|uniref:Molybdenum cofactor sulfurase n=1 Tax=Hexamita inflata TaxID=28002 RepID=A0AA86Q4N1_9EUKA|nr:Molybdenum cofactor sulfurase [Hexamita inflata]
MQQTQTNEKQTQRRHHFSLLNLIGILSILTLIFSSIARVYLKYKYRIDPKYTEFLKNHPNYGFNGTIHKLIAKELNYVPNNETYLDFTGAGQYQLKQVRKSLKVLEHSLKCNTHSLSACSKRTEVAIDEVRERILNFFNAPAGSYSVIFTQSSTSALHLIGDSFPWSNKSLYLYAKHNHNSVLGIRSLAKKFNASYQTLSWDQHQKEIINNRTLNARQMTRMYMNVPDDGQITHNLVAFPAECNFSGIKYPLELVQAFEANKAGEKYNPGAWHVLLDAAAFVPTNPLDLNKFPASFVVMSFYKMFGFPTGIGALLVRSDVAALMKKTYFAGGSVVTVSCDTDYCKLKPKYHEKFEDGTLDFISIDQLRYGFDALEELGMENIQDHVWAVTRRFYEGLSQMKHSNGKPLAEFYGNHELNDKKKQGGIVTFNLVDKNGIYIGYSLITKKCADANFMIRAGCSCNPGACHNFLGLNEEMVIKSSMTRTSCGDEQDSIMGKPLGAVRASFGYPTTLEQIDSFLAFLKEQFIDHEESVSKVFGFK